MNEQILRELRDERHADYAAEEEAAKLNMDCVANIVGGGNAAFRNNWRDAEREGYFIGCYTIGDFCNEYVKYLTDLLDRLKRGAQQ